MGIVKQLIMYAVFLSAATATLILAPKYFSTRNALPDKCFEEIQPEYLKTDPNSLIHIQDSDDILKVRSNIIKFLWKRDKLPVTMPTKINKDISPPSYFDAFKKSNLKQVDEIIIDMDLDFTSTVYHLQPIKSSNKLLVYHLGHSWDINANGGNKVIASFLEQGYAIIIFRMPMTGKNKSLTGSQIVSAHNEMKKLESDTINPLKFFVEPIAVSLNYVEKEYSYTDTVMMGVSGGGWTTTLYAAIDTRILKSFPVAGSSPLYLRTPPCGQQSAGDYEQGMKDTSNMVTSFYVNTASYLDLYILGAHGPGRQQVQILNKYDHCCHNGIRHFTYEKTIKDIILQLGSGKFSVALDTTHKEHKISQWGLDIINSNILPSS
jgi:hypothetical protein